MRKANGGLQEYADGRLATTSRLSEPPGAVDVRCNVSRFADGDGRGRPGGAYSAPPDVMLAQLERGGRQAGRFGRPRRCMDRQHPRA